MRIEELGYEVIKINLPPKVERTEEELKRI